MAATRPVTQPRNTSAPDPDRSVQDFCVTRWASWRALLADAMTDFSVLGEFQVSGQMFQRFGLTLS
jgi:hypothetical protein